MEHPVKNERNVPKHTAKTKEQQERKPNQIFAAEE